MKEKIIGGVIFVVLAVAVILSLRNANETGEMPSLFDESPETYIEESVLQGDTQGVDESMSDITENTMREYTTEGGVKVVVTKEGIGAESVNGDTVSVHYTGKLTDGTVFDSSIPRGQTFSFTLGGGQVIKGWEEGVVGMKVGEKRTLTIPSEMAYGAGGIPGVIPGGATLIFDVEMVSF